jgi:hypothetical protein
MRGGAGAAVLATLLDSLWGLLAAVVETATAWATEVREAGVNLEWCAGE